MMMNDLVNRDGSEPQLGTKLKIWLGSDSDCVEEEVPLSDDDSNLIFKVYGKLKLGEYTIESHTKKTGRNVSPADMFHF